MRGAKGADEIEIRFFLCYNPYFLPLYEKYNLKLKYGLPSIVESVLVHVELHFT